MSGHTTEDPLAPLTGGSVWEDQLFQYLVGHQEHERQILAEYEEMRTRTDSKALAYVIGLLRDDERRHHEVLRALAETLKQEAEFSPGEPAVPYLDFDRADAETTRDITMRMIRSEEEDAEELKRLHRMLRDVKDTTLWDLLVDIMRRDTEKHLAILGFVRRHL